MAKKPKLKKIKNAAGAVIADPEEVRARTERPKWATKKK
tara:strand:- start:6001 stop:6117 length:117 start_codon:yes stop_codon:yes gene_type:complete